MRLNLILVILISLYADATDGLKDKLESNLDTLMPKVIEWRHDIHQYPELGNREFRTSNKIKVHLESLGIDEEEYIDEDGEEKEFTVPMTVQFLWPTINL